jgi:hypothetical protein
VSNLFPIDDPECGIREYVPNPLPGSGMRTDAFDGNGFTDHQSDQNWTWTGAEITNTPQNPDPGYVSTREAWDR